MPIVAFDNTMLSVLLNPHFRAPIDELTGAPIEYAKERAEAVIDALQKSRSKIIIPTPAAAELLTAIGPSAQQYINMVLRSRVFEVASFDARCAAELALLNRDTFKDHDKKNGAEPYQKIKVDRQIIAICRVHGVLELYTDDRPLSGRARMCGITPVGIASIPIPDHTRQRELDLQPHDPIPGANDEEDDRPSA